MELKLNSADVAAMLRGHAQTLVEALQNPGVLDPAILAAHTARMHELSEHLANSIRMLRAVNDHEPSNGAKAA